MQDLEIFLNAPKNASAEELAAYLGEACGSDLELRQRVEELIAAEDSAGKFMERVPIEGAAEEVESVGIEGSGAIVGPYKLLQKIGEGGFGEVWMAEQSKPIQRMVALKLVKAGMDTKLVLARFEAERQALAMMDHPNIAQVHEAGATATGRPYFVMELVRGIPITQFCTQQRLGPRLRLELFRDVCSAVNHAHQKGVIHRDLKPSNVMVTLIADKPVVKVIDFGIAKATQSKLTDKTLFTRFEQFVGTPAYVSPEQTALSGLDIDTRSDIYSLGVLLYELLAGRPPFDPKTLLSAGYDEMRRIIREEEPPKPSTRLAETESRADDGSKTAAGGKGTLRIAPSAIKGELDWIVMKAIEKDRTRRYETANAFSADIARFLADEPVLAAAPSATYKLRKLAQRHRISFAVTIAIVLVLGGATLVSSRQAIRAQRAERVATERFEESEAIVRFMTELFQSPDPAREGRSITVAEMLDRAVEKLEHDLSDQPGRLARLRAVLGRTYTALGLSAAAVPIEEQARDYYLSELGADHPATLRVMHALASSLHKVGRREEALVLREEVLERRHKRLGSEHPDTISAMHSLASIYASLGRYDESFALRERVLPLSRKINGVKHPLTLHAMGNLSISYDRRGREEEASAMREEVFKLSREALGARHPDTLRAMANVAIDNSSRHRLKAAILLQEELVELRLDVSGADHPDTLRNQKGLAVFYTRAGRHREALPILEKVLARQKEIIGLEHRHTLQTLGDVAELYRQSGREEEGLAMQVQLVDLSRDVNGRDHADTLLAMTSLAGFYADSGQLTKAIALQEKTLAIKRRALPESHPFLRGALDNLGTFYLSDRRFDAAVKVHEEVLELGEKYNSPEHESTLGAMTNLAISYAAADRLPDAIKLQEQSLSIKRSVLTPNHPYLAVALRHMAELYEADGQSERAAVLREELDALKPKN